MEKEHIEGAKERARLVVDGMTKVKDQQARDVLKLVEHIEHQDHTVKRLENKVRELNAKLMLDKDTGGIFGSNPFGL